jgi:hypothetical protein
VSATYQNVSIFSWYLPNSVSQKKVLGETKKMPYYANEKFTPSAPKQAQGCTPFLADEYAGILPYCADNDILKSCEVNFPLKLDLLACKDLASQIKDVYGYKDQKPQEIQILKYTVPMEYQNTDVLRLLAEC